MFCSADTRNLGFIVYGIDQLHDLEMKLVSLEVQDFFWKKRLKWKNTGGGPFREEELPEYGLVCGLCHEKNTGGPGRPADSNRRKKSGSADSCVDRVAW